MSVQVYSEDQRTLTIGTQVQRWLIGAPNLYFSILHNNGTNELNLSVFYWTQKSFGSEVTNVEGYGIVPSYRFYHNGIFGDGNSIGDEIFYELIFGSAFANWTYESKVIPLIFLRPTINVGFNWDLDFGLSITPYLGAAYGIALGDEDGVTFTFVNFSTGEEQTWDGLVPSFGLDIRYTF